MAYNKKDLHKNLMQLDLATKYDELLRVHCRHQYFNNKALGGMEITPTDETKELLKKHQMVCAQDWSGFSIGYAMRPNYTPAEMVEKPLRLSFWMRLADTYFYNYTKIPYDLQSPMIYHFSNRSEGKEETGMLHLSKAPAVRGEDRVEIMPKMFDYEFADTLFDPTLVQVIDEVGEVYFEEMVEEFSMLVNINLAEAPSGKYYLLVGGTQEKAFYIYPSDLRKIFGVIDIYLDKYDFSDYGLFDGGKLIKRQYHLQFENRRIFWRYYFVENAPTPVHSEHSILDTNRARRKDGEDVFFTVAEEVTLENGSNAICISTQHPIALREQQDEKFKLRTKRGKNKMEWMTDLPCPTAKSNLKMGENEEIFSEMIVFL